MPRKTLPKRNQKNHGKQKSKKKNNKVFRTNNGSINNYICKECDGGGKVDTGWLAPIIETCPVCKGKGKVDWVTNITWSNKIPKEDF
jgi:hypothetical protein